MINMDDSGFDPDISENGEAQRTVSGLYCSGIARREAKPRSVLRMQKNERVRLQFAEPGDAVSLPYVPLCR